MDHDITSHDTEWHRFIKDTGTKQRIQNAGRDDIFVVPFPWQNNFTTTLRILNATQSHNGYYWVTLFKTHDVCNTTVTVATSM